MAADPKAYLTLFPVARTAGGNRARLPGRARQKATPAESDEAKIQGRLAERQARAAIALVRMGKAEEVLALSGHSPDPRLRSFIVNWLNPLGPIRSSSPLSSSEVVGAAPGRRRWARGLPTSPPFRTAGLPLRHAAIPQPWTRSFSTPRPRYGGR